ncbi:MAG: hypothetical protein NTW50_03295 [Candidatus Berkelbacteria bacterium]|nr:hypothetical protein [Candidatus Berkelbacteria bacterium]
MVFFNPRHKAPNTELIPKIERVESSPSADNERDRNLPDKSPKPAPKSEEEKNAESEGSHLDTYA